MIPDPRWSEWFRLAGVPNAKPEFVAARFPNYELEAQAALQGIGAALLSPVLFALFTAQGALIAPFSWVVEGPNRAGSGLSQLDAFPDQRDSATPVLGSRISFDARWSSLKSNKPLSIPAFESVESAPILPRSQLSSMKRRIED